MLDVILCLFNHFSRNKNVWQTHIVNPNQSTCVANFLATVHNVHLLCLHVIMGRSAGYLPRQFRFNL